MRIGLTELGLTLKKLHIPMTAQQKITEYLELLPGVPANEATVGQCIKCLVPRSNRGSLIDQLDTSPEEEGTQGES